MSFEEEMGVSAEVGVLGLSLYVLGLAMGPMTLAPLSEVSCAFQVRLRLLEVEMVIRGYDAGELT